MPRGILSAVSPGYALSGSLGSAWGEWNTCRGIFRGLASCAGSYWTSHQLNTETWGLHFTSSPILRPGSLGQSCGGQPRLLPCICSLNFSINLCVPLLSLPLLLACLLQPLGKMPGLQEVTVAQRQAHSLYIRNLGSQNLLFKMPVLLSIFSLKSSSYSRHLSSLRSKQTKRNKQKNNQSNLKTCSK